MKTGTKAKVRRSLVENGAPPEWNVRVMTVDDFYSYCDRDGIVVSEKPLGQFGLYMLRDGRPEIHLHELLSGADWLFVGFHELAHHWLSTMRIQFFQGRDMEPEYEADAVAACAMIPRPLLACCQPSEIAELYGYSPNLINLRREIFDRWQI